MKTVESRANRPAAPGLIATALFFSALLHPLSGQEPGKYLTSGDNETQNGGDVQLPWQARDKFDRVRFMNESSSHFIFKQNGHIKASLIFLPPLPPPLDSEIPVLAPLDPGPPAPQELSAFVGETFYPLLAARLAADDLPKALRVRLVAYRDGKIAIQNELRSRVAGLKDSDRETRERQLAALGAEEAQRIAGLEAEAENLRLDLRATGVLGLPAENPDIPEKFGWSIRSSRDTPSVPAELRREADALRGAAFLEDGLTLQQRRLLEEAAGEMDAKAGADPARNLAAPGTRLINFSPERSRISVPLDLLPALREKIDGYLAAKEALKAEIRDALHDAEETYGDDRRRMLARLAAAQATRLSATEAAAEDIRRDLADIPGLRGPPPPPLLPAELTARMATYRRHKVELLRTLRTMLVAPSPVSAPGAAPREPRAEDAGSRVQSWLHDGTSTSEIPPSSLRVSVAEFDRMQIELISELKREESGIRESLASFVRATNGQSDRKSINDLLRDFEDARQQQEIWDKYRDYRTAVLAPGLTTGQRRILFDAGIEQLGLALPGGERTH